jgi:hypothetical protein
LLIRNICLRCFQECGRQKTKTEVKGKTKQSKRRKKSAKTQKEKEGNVVGKENRDGVRRGITEHLLSGAVP